MINWLKDGFLDLFLIIDYLDKGNEFFVKNMVESTWSYEPNDLLGAILPCVIIDLQEITPLHLFILFIPSAVFTYSQ